MTTVAVAGCGLIGRKRVDALRDGDRVLGVFDVHAPAMQGFPGTHCASLGELLALGADVVVVATTHDQLAPLSVAALEAGSHVLVEKPAGLSVREVDRVAAAAVAAGRRVKVGFNHRFHPGLARLVELARSGEFGEVLHLRGRYGHGGRTGYDREWRADVRRSGGGEIIDQGMHLLDLSYAVLGEQPLHSALLRTQFWDTDVDDNAALLLGTRDSRTDPWAMLHVTWTEWKNMFSLEVYCRTAKLVVEGLVKSYGPQRLTVHRMRPELGPPDTEVVDFPDEDPSWALEWAHFTDRLDDDRPLAGDLTSAHYAWSIVEAAYEAAGYGAVREGVG